MTKVDRGTATKVARGFTDWIVGSGTAQIVPAQISAENGHSTTVQNLDQTALFVGNEFNQYYRLAQYDAVTLDGLGPNQVYVRGDGGTASYNWFALT